MSGYWNAHRMRIWHNMTPERRDYDRWVGVYPPGQAQCETEAGTRAILEKRGGSEAWFRDVNDHSCNCHINPPCAHCTDCDDCFGTEE